METKEINREIIEILGLEAYNVYKDLEKKHSIEVTILIGLSTSIIFEFLKGFIDFKGLGSEAKKTLRKFLNRYEDEDDLKKKASLKSEAEELIDLISKEINTDDTIVTKRGTENINIYLVQIGIPKETAKIKSEKIADKLQQALHNDIQ